MVDESRALGGGCSSSFLFESGFGLSDERFDGGDVFHGEVGEDFAVKIDTSGFESFHETGVAQAEGACGGVDALNPQIAEVALLGLAVACCVGFGFADGVLRITEMRGTEAAETLGFCQHALAALSAGGGVGGSWHVWLSMIRLLLG